MRFLVWQWGRFGSGPRIATLLAEGLRALPESEALLSLSTGAEILRCSNPPVCDLPVVTYEGTIGFLVRVAGALFSVRALVERIRRLAPEVAVCAQPAPLDLVMARALDVLRVPFIVLVHDADYHPGDGLPMQMWLQRMVCQRAAAIGVLSSHVGERLKAQGLAGTPARPLIRLRLPPIGFAMPPRCPRQNGSLRLLMFGRLLPYKGLDLLGEALSLLGSRPELEVRVVGSGPESPALDSLRARPGVAVENRWVPEGEVGALLAWSDALVLPYREASQSGIAAVALAAGRRVLATNVGGLAEQLEHQPLALLCEPDPRSLAAGLRQLLDAPPEQNDPSTIDPHVAWRDMAAGLCHQIEAMGLRASNSIRTPR